MYDTTIIHLKYIMIEITDIQLYISPTMRGLGPCNKRRLIVRACNALNYQSSLISL